MKTKKELMEELDKCHKLIQFYLGRDWDTLTREQLLDRLEQSKKKNELLTKILWCISLLLLCISFFLLGVAW